MKLQYRDNLLFTSIDLAYQSKTIERDNIVVDTGASFCIIDPVAVEEFGFSININDEIETFYGINGIYNYVKRKINTVNLDGIVLNDVDFYLGAVEENINGLLGLDILMKSNAVIDLSNMNIVFKK